MIWPEWWHWELEISSHVEKRMLMRNFNEIDLRTMLSNPERYERDYEEGRYIIITKYRYKDWEIVVEPDYEEKVLVIITAYSPEV